MRKGVKEVAEQQKNVQEQDINHLRKVRREKLADLQARGADPFLITKYDVTHHSQEIKDNFEELENKQVSIAGRIMQKRVMGKASFCNVQDLEGNIQSYVARDSIGEEDYKDFKKFDIGDIVGIKGFVFKTKTGEISIHAEKVQLLSKSLQILPEKFHGLTDTDTRYRQRYVDLIMNREVKDTFIKRSKILSSIRKYLDGQGFMEVETPMLVANAGGAAARPFETHFNALDEDFKLRISLELYLKRLIVGGFEGVYEFGKNFRNEGMDRTHNPEFTCMEIYVAYKDYRWMMEFTEQMLERVALAVNGTTDVEIDGRTISFKAPFRRITMTDAILEKTGYDITGQSEEQLREACARLGVETDETMGKGKLIDAIFSQYCEGDLIQPTFMCDYPIEMSPLSKRHRDNRELTERFELFVNGKELCNAYSELNDPIDQLERFKEQMRLSEKGDDEAMIIDMDFVRALEYGMPSCSGLGIGIDRLTMFMTGQTSIQDVLLFPTMRPEKKPVNDPKEKYVEIGVPEEWVEVIQKMGYVTVDSLRKLSPGKFFNDLCGFNKKNKLGLKAPSMEDVRKWCAPDGE